MSNLRTLIGALKSWKAFKKQETCLEQKKVARNPKSCSKVAQQLMDSPSLKGGPAPSQFKKVATISYMT